MTALHLFVPGSPAPQGSKRHVGKGRMVESSSAVGPWRERVALAAHQWSLEHKIAGLPIGGTPLRVTLKFVMPRPASTAQHKFVAAIKRPDIDKLSRAVLDALTDVWFADDSAVTHLEAFKRLAAAGETPGVQITMTTLAG